MGNYVWKEFLPQYAKFKKGILTRQEFFDCYTLNYCKIDYFDELGILLNSKFILIGKEKLLFLINKKLEKTHLLKR